MRREEFGLENLVKALNHMKGTLLICDRNRNVVYYNDVVCSALDIPEERLSGANLMGLAEEGYILNSASIQAFETRQLSIKYVRGKMKMPILTVSNPVLDENGEVALVVAVSFNEQITELVAREMMESRQKSIELLDFLSSKMSNNATVIAESAAMKGILAFLTRISPADSNILLTGETGAGKEVLAKYIHNQSSRSGGVFIPVNCAAIPESLMESEFFGYARGAFTGANTKGKVGLFEYANHGTLMLDEIGDMPMDLQVKLLRAIQSQEITRIGGTRPIKLDIRFLALTNADLKKKVAEGSFRQDLYYRLNVIPIAVPALRQRTEDFEELCRHFIHRFTKKYDRTFCLTEWQIDYMKRYQWPGNIRELENVMEYLILCSSGIGRIEDDVLRGLLNVPEENLGPQPAAPAIVECAQEEEPEELPPEDLDFNTAVAGFEKKLLEQVLKESSNLREASRKLNINASTICRKIKQYGIDYENRRS